MLFLLKLTAGTAFCQISVYFRSEENFYSACSKYTAAMLHVFNGPVEPVSLAEFQKAKGKKTLFTCHTVRLSSFPNTRYYFLAV